MNAIYTRVFQVGGGYHRLELYPEYTEEKGLTGNPVEYESTRMHDILNHVRPFLSTAQLNVLQSNMRDKIDVIVLENGSIKHPQQ